MLAQHFLLSFLPLKNVSNPGLLILSAGITSYLSLQWDPFISFSDAVNPGLSVLTLIAPQHSLKYILPAALKDGMQSTTCICHIADIYYRPNHSYLGFKDVKYISAQFHSLL